MRGRCWKLDPDQRGQAHLPDPEVIKVESLIFADRLSSRKVTSLCERLSGWEGGLAPALG